MQSSDGEQEVQKGTGRGLINWFKRASSILECPLDPIEEMGERRMLS